MNYPRELVILGSGGHASSVAEAADLAGFHVLKRLDVSSPEGSWAGALGELEKISLDSVSLALGLGTNHVRSELHAAVVAAFPNAAFPTIVHSSAWVSPTAEIHAGAVLLAHSIAGAHATVGVGALLNAGASLDHDSALNNFGSLGPGARTGGNVTIGARSMIGLQAGILQGRSVGEDAVVGAHSLVLEDIPSLCVAHGTPCKAVKPRLWNESYY